MANTTADKLKGLVDGKQYVLDKLNQKAETNLPINAKWQEIGDTIDNLASKVNVIGEWFEGETVVPNTGIIEKIYINKELSNEQVKKILKEANLFDEQPKNWRYIVYAIADEYSGIDYLEIYENGEHYQIEYYKNYSPTSIYNSYYGGWLSDYPYDSIEIQQENLAQYYPQTNEKIGQKNKLLKEIFSTTPFVKKTETKQLEGEYKGIKFNYNGELEQEFKLPDNGFVDKLYLDKTLSIEEVNNIFKKFVPQSDFSYKEVVLSDNATTNLTLEISNINGEIIYVLIWINKINNGKISACYISSSTKLTEGLGSIFNFNFVGWNPLINYIEINCEISELDIVPIKDLFYIIKNSNVINISRMMDKGEIPLYVEVNVDQSEEIYSNLLTTTWGTE